MPPSSAPPAPNVPGSAGEGGHLGNADPGLHGEGDDDWVEEDEDEDIDGMAKSFRAAPVQDLWGNPIMTVVHTNGIHFLQSKFCRCATALTHDRQVLFAGLYPASQIRVQTVFTQQIMDDCRMEKIECHTTVRKYFTKLKRTTSGAFHHLVTVSTLKMSVRRCRLTAPPLGSLPRAPACSSPVDVDQTTIMEWNGV